MARWITFKEALVPTLKNWRIWLLHLFGNAAIFLGFLWWLQISVAHWWNVLFNVVLIVVLAIAALVLHGGTLNYFQAAHENRSATLPPGFRKAFQHLAAVFVWALVFVLLFHLVSGLDDYRETLPGYLRSGFPAWLRRMISESFLDRMYSDLVWLLLWVVLPGLFLPFASFAAGRGFRGLIAFGDWRRMLGQRVYWITLLIACLIGVLGTGALMEWKLDPQTATLRGEEISLAFRLFLASLLGIFAWLLTCSMLGRLRGTGQSRTQPQ